MYSIKDIYRWVNDHPKVDPREKMTPLQLIEFNEKNKEFNLDNVYRNFVGEHLMSSPVLIKNITKNKFTAVAAYNASSGQGFEDGYRATYNLLTVEYEVLFDESFYESIRLIYNQTMVQIEGRILKFNSILKKEVTVHSNFWDSYLFTMQLQLSSISVIKNKELSASLIGASAPKNSGCFIATAAFGNQDISEVFQLREFRDKVLSNSMVGRFFIGIYYRLSPPIASLIRRNKWLRKITRSFLRTVILPITKLN